MSDTNHEGRDDETPMPHPAAKEPAEGGDVPEAGPGADRAER